MKKIIKIDSICCWLLRKCKAYSDTWTCVNYQVKSFLIRTAKQRSKSNEKIMTLIKWWRKFCFFSCEFENKCVEFLLFGEVVCVFYVNRFSCVHLSRGEKYWGFLIVFFGILGNCWAFLRKIYANYGINYGNWLIGL